MSRPKLWMLIGVPGSGKSTWIKNQFEDVVKELTTHVASTDILIEGLAQIAGKTYDEMFKSSIKYAEKTMYRNVASAVADDYDIIWDQTNLTRKTRAKKLILIPDHYEKIAVVFQTPEDLWERLIHRESAEGKSIPEEVVHNMIDTMEYPELDEGFNKVLYVDNGVTV